MFWHNLTIALYCRAALRTYFMVTGPGFEVIK